MENLPIPQAKEIRGPWKIHNLKNKEITMKSKNDKQYTLKPIRSFSLSESQMHDDGGCSCNCSCSYGSDEQARDASAYGPVKAKDE